jgi:hypothetical protein
LRWLRCVVFRCVVYSGHEVVSSCGVRL